MGSVRVQEEISMARMELLKTVFVSSFLLGAIGLHSQHINQKIELTEMEIISDQFKRVLDMVVNHEKCCDYYDVNLVFVIQLTTIGSESRIEIESLGDKNLALELQPYGFFYHKKHLFLLERDKNQTLFSERPVKKVFEYLKYDIFHQEFNTEGQLILPLIIDDSYTQWQFLYFQNMFVFENLVSFCH